MNNRTCIIEECGSKVLARKMCSKHYYRFMNHGTPHANNRMSREGVCLVESCGKRIRAKGFCASHYDAERRTRKRQQLCTYEGCTNGQAEKKLCKTHYALSIAGTYTLTCLICGTTKERKYSSNGRKAATCSSECKTQLAIRTKRFGLDSHISRTVRERNTEEFIQIIQSRVDINEKGCWVWRGHLNASGYGNTRCNAKTWATHRLVASMTSETYTEELPVHHTCANRACCNPKHLRVVTPQENAAEMMERNAYKRRIEELEAALAELCPDHSLLQ